MEAQWDMEYDIHLVTFVVNILFSETFHWLLNPLSLWLEWDYTPQTLLQDIPPWTSLSSSIGQFISYVLMILIIFLLKLKKARDRLLSSLAPPQPDVGPENTHYEVAFLTQPFI